MSAVRRLLAHRHLAALICAAALVLKLLVPTGYMIESRAGRIAVMLCPGAAPMTMTMEGMHGDMPDDGKPADHGAAELPCAFAGLSAATLGAIDPIQLAALIAFVVRVDHASVAPPALAPPANLRPPPRGPPGYP